MLLVQDEIYLLFLAGDNVILCLKNFYIKFQPLLGQIWKKNSLYLSSELKLTESIALQQLFKSKK